MNTQAPIYIIDDDPDDEKLVKDAFEELKIRNPLRFFRTPDSLLQELAHNPEVPFMIISNVNLPKMDGFELREKVLNESSLKNKSIPYIFWSTNASEAQIKKAYDLSIHGFFLKGRSYRQLKKIIQEMVAYWSDSLAPQQ